MKSKKNIVLIGMMGSGKSSIGKILSKRLNLNFIDIDRKIEEDEVTSISDIFKKNGEDYFRKIEEKISLKYLKSANSVISLGGGGFINSVIRKFCKKTSTSFWLNWNNDTIIKRIYRSKKRPLAIKLNKNQINNLINERSKIYKLSDHEIKCEKLDKVQIINKIINVYEDK